MDMCTHLYMVCVGSCQKCEFRNWGDVPGENLQVDKAMGNSGKWEVRSVTVG